MGRQLSGKRTMGGAFGFDGEGTRENRSGASSGAALLRKTRPRGNDLRAACCGTGKDGAELTMIEIRIHFVVLNELSDDWKDDSATARIQIIRDCKDVSAAFGEGTINVEPLE